MKPPTPSFLDLGTKREVDALYVLLIHSGRYELLPELYEVFGREHLIRFLELFGGTTITVPNTEDLAQAVRDVSIYCRMSAAPKEQQSEVAASLSKEYSVDGTLVLRIYAQMTKLMDRYDLRKITRDFARSGR